MYEDEYENDPSVGYCDRYEAYYCLVSLEWLAPVDCKCEVCNNRPPRFPYMKVVVNNNKRELKKKVYNA